MNRTGHNLEPFQSKINKILEHPVAILCFSACFALFSLNQRGLSLHPWITYGFQRTIKLSKWLPQYEQDVLLPLIQNATFPILQAWHQFISPIYENPALYISCSLIASAAIFLSAYLLSTTFFTQRTHALFAVVLVTIGTTSIVGGNTIGLWQGLYFVDSSMATIFILLAAYCLCSEKTVLSSLFFSIAFQFHLFNAFTSFVFIAAPFLFMALLDKKYGKCFRLLALPVIMLSMAIVLSKTINPLAESSLSMVDWLNFCFTRDPDDSTLMFWWNTIALPVAAGTMVYLASRDKGAPFKYVDSFILYFHIICFTALSIELMHSNGISFGKLSELFTITQLRRGIWVFHLITTFGILSNLFNKSSLSIPLASLFALYIYSCAGGTKIFPTILLGLAIFNMLLVGWKWKSLLATCYAILCISAASIAASIAPNNLILKSTMPLAELYTARYALYTVILCGLSFLASKTLKRDLPPPSDRATAIIAFCFVALCGTLSATAANSTATSTLKLLTSTEISYIDLIKQHNKNWNENDESYIQALDAAARYSRNGRVLVPPTISSVDPTFYAGLPLFLYEKYDRGYSEYSFKVAKDYDFRLKTLFDKGLVDFYQGDFMANLETAYKSLPPKKLIQVMAKHNINAIITSTPIKGARSVYSNDKYWLYLYSEIVRDASQLAHKP